MQQRESDDRDKYLGLAGPAYLGERGAPLHTYQWQRNHFAVRVRQHGD